MIQENKHYTPWLSDYFSYDISFCVLSRASVSHVLTKSFPSSSPEYPQAAPLYEQVRNISTQISEVIYSEWAAMAQPL
jgi:hypothetical protein